MGTDGRQTSPAWGHSPVQGQLPSRPRVVTAPPQRSAAAGSSIVLRVPAGSPGTPGLAASCPPCLAMCWPRSRTPRTPRTLELRRDRGVPRAGGDRKLRSSGLPGCRPRPGLPWGAGGFHSAHPTTFCFFFYLAFLIVISCGENLLLGSIPSAGGLAAANVMHGAFSPHQTFPPELF